MKEFIDNLMRVVNDPESMKNPSLLENTINGYDALKTDFGNLLIPSADNFHKGFVTYMQSIDNVNVQDDEVEDAQKYLHEHLESEVGMWTEEEVKDKLKDWRISKVTPIVQPTPSSNPSATIVAEPPVTIPTVNPDELKKKRNKAINRINNSEDLRQAIENMINQEESYVIDILLKYV